MERKIGEIFEYNGEWYQCLEEKTCTCFECDFHDYNCDDINLKKVKGSCQSEYRKDNKSVIFKKLEKVGEPYEYYLGMGIIMVQEYILANANYICEYSQDVVVVDCQNGKVAIETKQNKEDMEEKKLNLKPFDLEAAKAGKPVCTRDGRLARIICFNRKFLYEGEDYCIVALINEGCYNEAIYSYTNDGLYTPGKTNKSDLMMLSEKKEGWVNIVRGNDGKSYMGRGIFQSKEEAENTIKAFSDNLIDTIKICWKE